jgi:hypothetical protein
MSYISSPVYDYFGDDERDDDAANANLDDISGISFQCALLSTDDNTS